MTDARYELASNHSTAEDVELWRTLHAAAATPVVDAALRDLYRRVDQEIAARGPTCWQSGKCCRFDSYGHRLYVTALEIAWFVGSVELPRATGSSHPGSLPVLARQDACPYQVDGLCSAHTVRPLGCRIFFCERGTETWQQDLYERFLTELRRFHDRLGLPYRYMEWRAGLDEAFASAPAVQE